MAVVAASSVYATLQYAGVVRWAAPLGLVPDLLRVAILTAAAVVLVLSLSRAGPIVATGAGPDRVRHRMRPARPASGGRSSPAARMVHRAGIEAGTGGPVTPAPIDDVTGRRTRQGGLLLGLGLGLGCGLLVVYMFG